MEVMENVEGMAKAIGLTPSTVKKYYLLFEQEGYKFKRSNEGYILFSEFDIELFKELIALKNKKGMTVPKAVKQLVKDNGIIDITNTTDITIMTKQITTVMTEITELKQLVKQQQEQFQQQQEYIKNSLERRDQELMRALKESMQHQKLIAASIQEEKKEKKSWWNKLFSK